MEMTALRATVQAALIGALSITPLAASAGILVPSALVEEVKSQSAGVEFMDYVGRGQVIRLAPNDVLVLSYLKSCAHETITGGSVHIGFEQSEVEGGKVDRTKVPCSGGMMKLSAAEADASAASAFRLQSAAIEPTLYAMPPMIEVNSGRTLVIQRLDHHGKQLGDPQEIDIAEQHLRGKFFDLADAKMQPLKRGAIYRATLGHRSITFKIDAKAKIDSKRGTAPVVSRLLRFTPG
jgi:hypothetical protein